MRGRHEVARLKRLLDNTFSRVNDLGSDLEVQSDFARYLCVLVAGYIENAVVELILAHCSRQSSPTVQRYVEKSLDRFTNVHREKLLQLLGSFDAEWRSQLEAFIVDEREAALSSVIGLRHQIAHGGSAGITYVRIKQYYESIQEIIDYLTELLDPVPYSGGRG